MALTHGSLFSGIGGFDLGFERAGIRTIWQVEIDAYCRRVLEKRFPHAKRHGDVRTVGKHNLEWVDVLSGGFPCQDISNAGKRAGIGGERSGLWSEYARIICELRPRYVVVENVAALLGRGIERVLGDLASIGYDAEWQSIRASDVGAPHRRERIWILAYPDTERRYGRADEAGRELGWPQQAFSAAGARRPVMANDTGERAGRLSVRPWRPLEAAADAEWSGEICDSTSTGFPHWTGAPLGEQSSIKEFERSDSDDDSNADGESQSGTAIPWGECNHWAVEPDVGRVAHGIPAGVDRLRGLGNAIVPQIAEWIGERIVQAEAA